MKTLNEDVDPLAAERDLSSKRGKRRGIAGKVASREATEPHNIKVQISIKLDSDVLEHFKARAKLPGAVPYQTQINQALRQVMQHQQTDLPHAELLNDEQFLAALTDRIKARL